MREKILPKLILGAAITLNGCIPDSPPNTILEPTPYNLPTTTPLPTSAREALPTQIRNLEAKYIPPSGTSDLDKRVFGEQTGLLRLYNPDNPDVEMSIKLPHDEMTLDQYTELNEIGSFLQKAIKDLNVTLEFPLPIYFRSFGRADQGAITYPVEKDSCKGTSSYFEFNTDVLPSFGYQSTLETESQEVHIPWQITAIHELAHIIQQQHEAIANGQEVLPSLYESFADAITWDYFEADMEPYIGAYTQGTPIPDDVHQLLSYFDFRLSNLFNPHIPYLPDNIANRYSSFDFINFVTEKYGFSPTDFLVEVSRARAELACDDDEGFYFGQDIEMALATLGVQNADLYALEAEYVASLFPDSENNRPIKPMIQPYFDNQMLRMVSPEQIQLPAGYNAYRIVQLSFDHNSLPIVQFDPEQLAVAHVNMDREIILLSSGDTLSLAADSEGSPYAYIVIVNRSDERPVLQINVNE